MTQSAPRTPEQATAEDTSIADPARYSHGSRDAGSRGLRSRWTWFAIFGLLLMIALAIYLYSGKDTFDPTERGFPNYMQNTDR